MTSNLGFSEDGDHLVILPLRDIRELEQNDALEGRVKGVDVYEGDVEFVIPKIIFLPLVGQIADFGKPEDATSLLSAKLGSNTRNLGR